MKMAEQLRAKIQENLQPFECVITDESGRHEGHAGARPGGETHFHVVIVSEAFKGLNRVERQRKVYALLAQEMRERIHALSLTLRTPDETALLSE